MRKRIQARALVILFLLCLACPQASLRADQRDGPVIAAGKEAPHFTLPDLSSKPYINTAASGSPTWKVYYFFDIQSVVCQDGLALLDTIQEHREDDVAITAITATDNQQLREFIKSRHLKLRVLVDADEKISTIYDALSVFPKTIVINPNNTIVEVILGVTGSIQSVLTAVVDDYLLKGQGDKAEALLESPAVTAAVELIPEAGDKVAVAKGYALLKKGAIEEAGQLFQTVQDEVLRLEGQAAVDYQKGGADKTEQRIRELLRIAPQNTYAHTLRAKLHFKNGNVEKALQEYEQAVTGQSSFPWQQADAENNFGRALAKNDQPDAALIRYDRALSIYPDYVVPLSNKAVVLNREEKYEEAQAALDKARKQAPGDHIIKLLIEKNSNDLAFSKDYEKQQWVQQMVNKLAERYRSGSLGDRNAQRGEEWTSRPLTLSLLPIEEQENNPERDGDIIILYQSMVDSLGNLGRGRLLERRVLDKLLEELNLGSSDLVDRKKQLKLGKLLAARLIVAADIHLSKDGQYYTSIRLVDTESSEVVGNKTIQIPGLEGMAVLQDSVTESVASILVTKYPFRCKIVQVEGDEVVLNLGRTSGFSKGIQMQVIEQGKPIVFEGEVLGHKKQPVGEVNVVKVDEKMAFGRLANVQSPVIAGMLCEEK